jgi:hypothetical protein
VSQDIFRRVVERKERQDKKRDADFSDRVRRETKDTLGFFERQFFKGKSDREIMRDLDRSRYKNK